MSSIAHLLQQSKLTEEPAIILRNAGEVDAAEFRRAVCAMPYSEFMQTIYWQAVSITVKERAGKHCQICNAPKHLEAHHRTYAIHGREHLFLCDMTCLCRKCHGLYHRSTATKEPAARQQRKPRKTPEERKATKLRRFFRRASRKLQIDAVALSAMGAQQVTELLLARRDKKASKHSATHNERLAAFKLRQAYSLDQHRPCGER